MELLFVTVIAACIAVIVRYTLPRRDTYGILLLPALSATATAVTWVGLLWIGLTFDGTWIWVISLAVGITVAVIAALVLPGRRVNADARLFDTLSGNRT